MAAVSDRENCAGAIIPGAGVDEQGHGPDHGGGEVGNNWSNHPLPAGKYDDGVDVCSLIGRGLETVRLPAQLNAGRSKRPNRNHRFEYDPYAIREDEIEKGAFH